MATRTTIRVEGEERDALELDFDAVEEGWNIYEAERGITAKVKLVVMRLFAVLDENGEIEYTDSGEPFVVARYQHNTSAIKREGEDATD